MSVLKKIIMKQFFFLLLGVLLIGTADAQTVASKEQITITFPTGKIASQEWVNQYVKAKIDSIIAIGIIKPEPDKPSLPNCKEGPTITAVSADATGITYKFHGVDIKGLEYTILGPVYELVTKGTNEPKSNTFKIGFSGLPSGNYRLILTATTCNGKDTKDFTYKK